MKFFLDTINDRLIAKTKGWEHLTESDRELLADRMIRTAGINHMFGSFFSLLSFVVIVASGGLLNSHNRFIVLIGTWFGLLCFSRIAMGAVLCKKTLRVLYHFCHVLTLLTLVLWLYFFCWNLSTFGESFVLMANLACFMGICSASYVSVKRNLPVSYAYIFTTMIVPSLILMFAGGTTSLVAVGAVSLLYGLASFALARVIFNDHWSAEIGVIALENDISKRELAERQNQRMQEKLLQSAKFASIGELAAGVAHEVNNPLAILQGRIELFRRYLKSQNFYDDKVVREFAVQQKAILRISNIVSGLRTYARTGNEVVECFNINDIIENYFSSIRPIYEKQGIQIRWQKLDEELFIRGNVDQFSQVVTNLVSNARHAVSGNQEKIITLTTQLRVGQVCLIISDNGSGIPRQIQGKIFDTFFTTKEIGEGTGIGLSIVHNVVTTLKGNINVESKEGVGTSFAIELPRAETDRPSQNDQINLVDQLSNLSGNILIAEDDEELREVLVEQLAFSKLKVFTAQDVHEAIFLLREHLFDYVVADITMCDLAGMGLVEHLSRDERFKGKLVVISGEHDVDLRDYPVNALLRKPFRMDSLIHVLSQ